MMSMRRSVVFVTMILSVGLSAAWSESKPVSEAEKKLEDSFKVKWTRISYSKTVSLSNEEVSQDQKPDVSERLSLSCEVEILDPNRVLGISREPIIEQIKDDKGGDIEIAAAPGSTSSFGMRYEPPRYRRHYVSPTRPSKWKTALRSTLGLAPPEGSEPQWVDEIQPSTMQINLGAGLSKQPVQEISRVGGHLYALVAESYEYVDVPFEKSDKWYRLTPDVEIQIDDAWSKESSFRLSTKARPQGRSSMNSLSVGSYLPARIVVNRQLITQDGKPRDTGGIHSLPFHIGGGMSGSGGFKGTIEKIRYTIAVNPTHYEVPFVLEHIPLPKP